MDFVFLTYVCRIRLFIKFTISLKNLTLLINLYIYHSFLSLTIKGASFYFNFYLNSYIYPGCHSQTMKNYIYAKFTFKLLKIVYKTKKISSKSTTVITFSKSFSFCKQLILEPGNRM